MSNVVPFRPRAARPRQSCSVVAVADDLFAVLEQLESLVERAALTGRPVLEVEHTVNNLLTALGAAERALDCLGEGNEAAPG